MATKDPEIGCRIATMNVAKKIFSDSENVNEVVTLMTDLDIDIQMITEPGKADVMAIANLKNMMIKKDMAAEVLPRGRDTYAGGQVALIGRRWAKLQRRLSPSNRPRLTLIEY